MRHYIFTIALLIASCTQSMSVQPNPTSNAVAVFNRNYPLATPLSDGYATVNNVRYHYVTAGEGPLVILYHGFPSFWYAWKFQIAELAKYYRVVAIDGLGSNLSDKPTAINRYKVDSLAEDLNQLAYQLGGDTPFYLVGHDWGGALSWYFSQRYPTRVEKLVVLNAPPYDVFLQLLRDNEQQKKTSRYMDFLRHPLGEALLSFNDSYLIWTMAYKKHLDAGRIDSEEGELFRHALSRPQALHSAINWYRANMPDDETLEQHQDGPKIIVPSLVIWGDRDKTFVPEFLDMLPSAVENFSIQRFSDAAHWPSLSHSNQVNRAIIDFLETSPPSAASGQPPAL